MNREDAYTSSKTDRTQAALYARASSDRQDVALSVAAQMRALRDCADKNDYSVVRECVDEAERTEVPFEEILVWKFSCFTRKREHAVVLKSMLRRKGLRVVSITEQAEDSPTGRLLEGIIETVDESYSGNLAMEVLSDINHFDHPATIALAGAGMCSSGSIACQVARTQNRADGAGSGGGHNVPTTGGGTQRSPGLVRSRRSRSMPG